MARSILPPALAPLLFLAVLSSAACTATPAAPAPVASDDTSRFDSRFTGRVLRLDYFHTGHPGPTGEGGADGRELFAEDRVRVEGEWPGSRTALVDDTGLGAALVEVFDAATGELLWSRGHSTIFLEWATTGPARAGEVRTFAEAVRFPEPRRPVEVVLSARDRTGAFEEVWRLPIDPASRHVQRDFAVAGDVRAHGELGDVARRVDLLFLGDGYTAAERGKFHADVDRLAAALFEVEPFRSRRADFNVRSVFVAAAESGISNPRAGIHRDSPLGSSYDSLDSDRYVLTLDDRAWRDAAAAAPYDHVVLLTNTSKYGGGGIFNLYSTAAADSAFAPYLVVHEFGHHFAGLGDEYFTSQVAYEEFVPQDVEPWEPNVTALLDPDALKWKDLVPEGTPLPTPWSREGFERTSIAFQERRATLRATGAPEAELEELFARERETMTAMLSPHAGSVGAFEGAMYRARGLYRPAVDCIMFTRDPVGFCPVCSRAIERIIDLHVR